MIVKVKNNTAPSKRRPVRPRRLMAEFQKKTIKVRVGRFGAFSSTVIATPFNTDLGLHVSSCGVLIGNIYGTRRGTTGAGHAVRCFFSFTGRTANQLLGHLVFILRLVKINVLLPCNNFDGINHTRLATLL